MRYMEIPHAGVCDHCGKQRFTSARLAKLAARVRHHHEPLTAYLCHGWWHYGHGDPSASAALAQAKRRAVREGTP